MNLKKISVGSAAYTLVTFPLAAVWHVVIFKELYYGFGYVEGEPNFLLGFLTILMQGTILSALFPKVRFVGSRLKVSMKFAALIGSFFWTSHVLAFVAKQAVEDVVLFVLMETIYLALQFGIFGFLIGLIYGSHQRVEA